MCNLVRNTDGLINSLPNYYLNVYNNNKLLIIANLVSFSSNYEFSIDRDKNDSSDDSIIGRMKSNIWGTKFNLYNEGSDHKDKKSALDVKIEYACITYVSNYTI